MRIWNQARIVKISKLEMKKMAKFPNNYMSVK